MSDPALVLQMVRIAMDAISSRILTFVTMLLCGGAFAWALSDPAHERIIAAAAFAILVFWPIVHLEKKGGTNA